MNFLTILGIMLFIIGAAFSSYIYKTSNRSLLIRPIAFYDPFKTLIWKIFSMLVSIVGVLFIYFNFSTLAIIILVIWIVIIIIKWFIFNNKNDDLKANHLSNLNNQKNEIIDQFQNNLNDDIKEPENIYSKSTKDSHWDDLINKISKVKEETIDSEEKKRLEKFILYLIENKNRSEKLVGIMDFSKWKSIKKNNYEEYYSPEGYLKMICKIDIYGNKNGEFKVFSDNGKVISTGNYNYNYLDGEIINYYENGNTSMIINYSYGIFNGKTLSYYETGELESINHYKNGYLEGNPEIFWKDGTVISIK